jgi:high frequency lysogenization protein
MHTDQERAIALAALSQITYCIQRITYDGIIEDQLIAPCLYSLLQVDADNVESIYDLPGSVTTGAQKILKKSPHDHQTWERFRYIELLMRYEKKLHQQQHQALLTKLRQQMLTLIAQCEHEDSTDSYPVAQFASIYIETIGQIKPRILIHGQKVHLQDHHFQCYIRALLLAGIRAAMLWHQLGGSRWLILWRYRSLVAALENYLTQHRAVSITPPS